jgi:small-conductance mechanosensitive channel
MVLAGVLYAYHFYFSQNGAYFFEPYVLIVIVFLVSYLTVSVLRFSIITSYRQRSKVEIGEYDNFILGVDSLGRIIIVMVMLGSVWPIFDLPLNQFLTSFSLFAVALVWMLNPYLHNFFDSFRLMFSRDFLIGDYVKVSDSSRGVITDITFRATKLRTDDGDVLFVPNSTLMGTEVANFSKLKFKRIRVPFTIPTKQLQDIEAFEVYLLARLTAEFEDLVNPNKVFLRITGIEGEESSCVYEVSVDQYSFKTEDRIAKVVYQAVLEYTFSK